MAFCFLGWGWGFGLGGGIQASTLPEGFSEERVHGPDGANWANATGMHFEDNGRMYVWERGGRVWFQEYGTTAWRLLIDLSDEVGSWGDLGLLGFALDPEFRLNGHFYLMYVVDRHHLLHAGKPTYSPVANEYSNATIGRITRYSARVSDGFSSTDPGSRKVLLGDSATNGVPILYFSHGVGSLVFGTDGTLLASTGDGASFVSTDVGSASETYFARALTEGIITPSENVGAFRSQIVDSLSGKILRIDPTTGAGVPSNPFYDPEHPQAAKSKVWALGFRNPYRFTVRPGSGSHVPSDANPGVLYIGDVGWSRWEEFNICNAPGLNFGWPWFEGIEPQPTYSTTIEGTPNGDAPNPLSSGGPCPPYFSFGDLIRQNTTEAAGQPPFDNPCDAGQKIPGSIPQFLQTPPTLDWRHGSALVRTWIRDSNGAATAVRVDSPESPVNSAVFPGNCSIGGSWYTGTDFPAEYRNTYFHADYGANWIRSFSVGAADKLMAVQNFATGVGGIVALATHPIDGGLYYISMPSSLTKITYSISGNLPPTAKVTASHSFGPGPLTVEFVGTNSTDPEGLPLVYDWDFGDGTEHSSEATPVHTFEAPPGVPTWYIVTLRVSDSLAQTAIATWTVSVNNTPPQVAIANPVHGSKYSMNGETIQELSAVVTDAESPDEQLQYEWRVYLHHNNHEHQDFTLSEHLTAVPIAPIGCDGLNIFYYRVELTVTDSAGLSTTTQASIFPECGFPDTPPVISVIADQVVPKNQKAGPLAFAVSDAEVASPYLEMSATSSNPALAPNSNIVFGESGGGRTVTVRPITGASGTATITLSVNDGPNTTQTSFQLEVTPEEAPVLRTSWLIGFENDPALAPYRPTSEFSPENFRNDPSPGTVTRLPGDPEYVATSNPTADDDFYFAGQFPAEFNALSAPLNVPNDEPPAAWERAHTSGDRTNRLHFILDPAQVTAASSFQLSFKLVIGGSLIGGGLQPGFGDHDMVVRFRNAAGATTSLYSQRISSTTNIVLNFAASEVQALSGPNSIEIVREGPLAQGVSYFVQYDYLRLDSHPVGNTSPVLAVPPNLTRNELTPISLILRAADSDLPAQRLTYSVVSGPPGLSDIPDGNLMWTPTEEDGPGVFDVVVRVTDDGTPSLAVTNHFFITIREVNASPMLEAIPNRSVEELTPLQLTLGGSDPDVPSQALTYSLVSGPEGLTVSPSGELAWTPTEAQGPQTYSVVVRITDDGSPPLSADVDFSVTVNEVNVAPAFDGIANQTVNVLTNLSLQLSATDVDVPAQSLTYALVNGPEGLIVSETGGLEWTPTQEQGPGTYEVSVQVLDSGVPVLGDTQQFTIRVDENAEPALRTSWQIGTDDDPAESPYRPTQEFSLQNNRNDSAPGEVTRLAEDPEYNAASNPTADDDFYFAGLYPSGFNGLSEALRVPNDEPPSAWERAHTLGDRTNRLHFVLDSAQVTNTSSFRLSFDLVDGDWMIGGALQPGFGDHDLVVRLRNAVGIDTVLYSRRITNATRVVVDFGASAAGATAGANTIEIVRTGPSLPGVSYWVQYDFLRLESLASGNLPPVFTPPFPPAIPELAPLTFPLSARDPDVPAQSLTYALVSGPDGLTVNDAGELAWTPTEAQGPGVYPVVVRVTDDSPLALGAEAEFSIEVLETNAAPALAAISNQIVDELVPWTLPLQASDPDFPVQSLDFEVVSGPEGLTVSPAGELQWTPSEAQGPTTNEVVIRVTDEGTPPLSAEVRFLIEVREVNLAPVLSAVSTQIVDERVPWFLPLQASDPDLPAHSVGFEVVRGPAGLTVSPAGELQWTPSEAQGPSTNEVVIRATDDGIPSLSAEVGFSIEVREVNHAPVFAPVPNQIVDELATWRHTLQASDSDLPVQSLVFEVLSGPEGLTISPAGELQWTPSEAQGPSTNEVVIRATDDGIPSLSADVGFSIEVREVNRAPVFVPVPNQIVDELATWRHTLQASDSDLPVQSLAFEVLSGPEGLTVSPAGDVEWTPTEAQGPGSYTVEVRVTDGEAVESTAQTTFTIQVLEVPDPVLRMVWQIGINNETSEVPYSPAAEFGPLNGRNDAPPGTVTRLPSDPEYVQESNPAGDDDFYFAGQYSPNFNGLLLPLNVPHDEPSIAWERGYTQDDRTNRVHFVLDPSQTTAASSFRLTIELVSGGEGASGIGALNFGNHVMAVRFRNAVGISTELFSGTITQATVVTIPFLATDVAATAGANTLEIVRTGPATADPSEFINYDYLRLENDAGLLSYQIVSVSGKDYLAMTYRQSESTPNGLVYVIESTANFSAWSPVEVVVLSVQTQGPIRTTTVRDSVPLDSATTRFFRLRVTPTDGLPTGR